MLNPRYSFESLVIGSHNASAVAAARRWVEDTSPAGSLLLIKADGPFGKTHLAHGTGHALRDQAPGIRVEFAPALYLENTFVDAIVENTVGRFRQRFCDLDALLIDDVQTIVGSVASAGVAVLCAGLLRRGKKILVTGNDSECATLASLLGLENSCVEEARLTVPDLSARMAIVRAKAALLDAELPDTVARLLVERAGENLWRLEAFLFRVTRVASGLGLRLADLDQSTLEAVLPVP